MANVRILEDLRNQLMQQIIDAIDAGSGPGTLKIYTGVQPASADDALSGNTLLATLTFSDPAAPSPSAGVITFDVITEDSAADATGTATWARIQDSDGNVVFDGDCGLVSDDDALIQFPTVSFVAGGPVQISSFTLTMPASMSF